MRRRTWIALGFTGGLLVAVGAFAIRSTRRLADPTVRELSLCRYGDRLIEAGRLSKAEKFYRGALVVFPEDSYLQVELGTVLARRQRTAEAEECYRKALLLEPDSGLAHFNLGSLLWRAGQFAEAQKHYRLAEQLCSSLKLPDSELERSPL